MDAYDGDDDCVGGDDCVGDDCVGGDDCVDDDCVGRLLRK